jgi:drug/metabolite transporter (DMT)-like permease
MTSRDTLSLAFWAFVIATVFWTLVHPWWTVPWDLMNETVVLPGDIDGLTVPVWGLIAWVIVLGTVVPFLLVLGALRHLPVTTAGIVGMVEPVLAGIVAWIWLGENLSFTQIVGAVVVLVGILIAQLATN